MSSKDQKIEDLKRELALTRIDFSSRLQGLEQKISALTDGNDINVRAQFEQSVNTPAEANPPSKSSKPLQPLDSQNQLAAFDEPLYKAKTDSVAKPSFIASLIKESSALVLGLLSPIAKFTAPLFNLYQHYQAKGQGPIFVFMLIGIALLVGGFGYQQILTLFSY